MIIVEYLFSAIIAVNGSARVGIDTHKWFNPQIQFNPGMLHWKFILYFSALCICPANIFQTVLMTNVDHKGKHLLPLITWSFDLSDSETNKNLPFTIVSSVIKLSYQEQGPHITIRDQLPTANWWIIRNRQLLILAMGDMGEKRRKRWLPLAVHKPTKVCYIFLVKRESVNESITIASGGWDDSDDPPAV